MTKRILFSILTFAVALTTVFYIQGCDVKSPIENVKVILDANAPTTPASVSFFDANSSNLISSEIAVSIIGPDKDKITDFGRNPKTAFTSSGGIVAFAVKDGSTFPVNVTVVATVNGYITTSMPVTIAKSGGAYSIYMVNKSNPPAGVRFTSSEVGFASPTGAVTTAFTVTTPFSGSIGGVGKIRLPAGTIITDVTSAPLTGVLRTEVAYFDPTVETALRCFPGGFNAGSNYMYSAGFTSIEITDASGKSAKTFTGDSAEVTIEIPNNAVNTSGNPIAIGESIPVFSYNAATGTNAGAWVLEKTGTVVAGSNGNKAIIFKSSHLSYWNLDYYGPNCTGGISRTVKLVPASGGCSQVPLELRMFFITSAGETYYRTVYVSASDSVINFYNAPSANMVIRVFYNGVEKGTSGNITLCGGGDLVINYNLGFTPQSISGTVIGVCENNPNVEIRPTLPIYYRVAGTTNWMYLGYMVNGVLTGNCAAFGNYDFLTYYGNQAIYALNVSITTNNISFTYNLPSCN